MMVRGLSARCRVFFESQIISIAIGIFLTAACATAKAPPNEVVLSELKPPPVNVKAEISSQEVVAGTIALVTVKPSEKDRKKEITAEFEGIELPFFPLDGEDDGAFGAVVSIPYDRKPGPGAVRVKIGTDSDATVFQLPLTVIDGKYRSEILHVDKRRVNPTNPKDLKRIMKEQAEVAEIYKRVTREKFWKGPFTLPISSKITSPFGTRRLYNGQLKNFHPGLDLKAPMKTPVYSAAPGVVVLAKNLFYTGNTVMIDHGYGIITLYAHMTRLNVKLGDRVPPHAFLGLSGKTGRVNGPHLHWQAVVHRVKINPLGLTQVIR